MSDSSYSVWLADQIMLNIGVGDDDGEVFGEGNLGEVRVHPKAIHNIDNK